MDMVKKMKVRKELAQAYKKRRGVDCYSCTKVLDYLINRIQSNPHLRVRAS